MASREILTELIFGVWLVLIRRLHDAATQLPDADASTLEQIGTEIAALSAVRCHWFPSSE
jgi:hypothetical protein